MPWKPDLVREARERCGWTQDELAERVGVHRITITRVESGALRPGVDLFEALAKALKVDPAELLGLRTSRRRMPKAATATKRSRP
jgi:transcriptional regulator with XRE-family HTH domain